MATTTTQEEILTLKLKPKQPSERLQQLINECATGFQKIGQTIELTLKVAREEGFSDKEIGLLIRTRMQRAGLDSSTIRRHLPANLKRNYIRKVNVIDEDKSRNLRELVGPEDYQTDKLDTYPRQFLIKIIRYLEQSSSTQIEHKNITLRPLSKKMPEQVAKQVIQLHKQNKSSRAIASQLGIGKTSVLKS